VSKYISWSRYLLGSAVELKFSSASVLDSVLITDAEQYDARLIH
jgi:hypothetical protein